MWSPEAIAVVVALLFWGLLWKGAALWISAKRDENIWFVVILVTNTLGILEIVYLLFIAKDKKFRRAIGLPTEH